LSQNLDEAKRVATQAQVAIVFVYTSVHFHFRKMFVNYPSITNGIKCHRFSGEIGIGFSSVQGNFGDRNDLKVYDKGDELVKAVASVNSKTIVVIHSVGSVVIEEWAEHPNITAILMAGLPGEQTGTHSPYKSSSF
jgi:beta-glucosidase